MRQNVMKIKVLKKASIVGNSEFRQINSANQEAKMKLDYNSQDVYVGLDVHKKSYSVVVVLDGAVIKKARMPADGIALGKSLQNWFPGARIHSAYEAGFCGFGLHRSLVEMGIKNIVVNAASIETSANDRKKTDARDARKLAEQLAAKRLKKIYVPTVEEELRRQITRTRSQIMIQRNRTGNQIKTRLFYFGIIAPENDMKMGVNYLKWIEGLELPQDLRKSLNYLIASWRHFQEQLKQIEVDLQEQSFEDPEVEEIYRSVPGVGLLSARILSNELGDLSKRFSNQDAAYQYTGLTPSEYSSGEKVHKGNIDRKGSPRIRHILVEIAWRAIKVDLVLQKSFAELSYRRGKSRAIVAIARRLIGRMRACFVKKMAYNTAMAV